MARFTDWQAGMTSKKITIARIYTMEGHDLLNQALDILHDEEHIMGVTIFRGIAGMGASGEIHTSSLVDLSLELPLVLEFYDEPEKVAKAMQTLKTKLDFKHIVSWSAMVHI
jgi:PII-like signaling protein